MAELGRPLMRYPDETGDQSAIYYTHLGCGDIVCRSTTLGGTDTCPVHGEQQITRADVMISGATSVREVC